MNYRKIDFPSRRTNDGRYSFVRTDRCQILDISGNRELLRNFWRHFWKIFVVPPTISKKHPIHARVYRLKMSCEKRLFHRPLLFFLYIGIWEKRTPRTTVYSNCHQVSRPNVVLTKAKNAVRYSEITEITLKQKRKLAFSSNLEFLRLFPF